MTETAIDHPGAIGTDGIGRRKYSVAYKRELAQAALEPGATLREIARRHDLNPKQPGKRRQWFLERERQEAKPAARFLSVRLRREGTALSARGKTGRSVPASREPGRIELERGALVWSQATDGVIALTPAQLAMLLEGIELKSVKMRKRYRRTG